MTWYDNQQPHRAYWPQWPCWAYWLYWARWLRNPSSRRFRKHCKNNIMVAQARSNTQSCQAIKCYWNNKCGNILLLRCLTATHLFAHEGECWWLAPVKKKMWPWIASFGESYLSDVLQYTKQLFSLRLRQMKKYCVMRECYNILSGYLSVVTTVFSQQDGIYGFNFPKKFLDISSRDLTLFSTLII
jgi:hypothetical protein